MSFVSFETYFFIFFPVTNTDTDNLRDLSIFNLKYGKYFPRELQIKLTNECKWSVSLGEKYFLYFKLKLRYFIYYIC